MIKYRDSLLQYLERERDYIRADIDEHLNMSDTQKVEAGLLIRDAKFLSKEESNCEFEVIENNTKLRTGDKVFICIPNSFLRIAASAVKNQISKLLLFVRDDKQLENGMMYRIEVDEIINLDVIITALSNVRDGLPGCYFLEYLKGCRTPPCEGKFGKLSKDAELYIPKYFNEKQKAACLMEFKRPAVACLQGIPGSGKTHVLAVIAQAFSRAKRSVVIIALTHQAVNNALNKVKSIDPQLAVVKIGDPFRTEGLDERIDVYERYSGYLDARRENQKRCSDYGTGHIVGMTLAASAVNFGLRNGGFGPSIALIDEAAQLPLAEAAVVGTFPTGSFIFIGDDIQMPPIYHSKLNGDPLSKSIFTVFADLYPQNKIVLDMTYRMNGEITEVVNQCFYTPKGIVLSSAPFSRDRTFMATMKDLLGESSLVAICCDRDGCNTDSSLEEAEVCVDLLVELIATGIKKDDMALVTPFRRQVKLLREKSLERINEDSLPLIDTVERLQGQDVEVIILSFASSHPLYCDQLHAFLMDKHRLNVMISRAKTKVIIVASPQILSCLQEIGIKAQPLCWKRI